MDILQVSTPTTSSNAVANSKDILPTEQPTSSARESTVSCVSK